MKDGQEASLYIAPIVFEDRDGESFFAGEIGVKRPFRHASCIGDLFDAAGCESTCMHELESRFEQAATYLGVGGAWHATNLSRPVAYLRPSRCKVPGAPSGCPVATTHYHLLR